MISKVDLSPTVQEYHHQLQLASRSCFMNSRYSSMIHFFDRMVGELRLDGEIKAFVNNYSKLSVLLFVSCEI